MKKIRNLLVLFALSLTLAFFATACDIEWSSTTYLDAPGTLSVENGVLTWGEVANSSGYKVMVDDDEFTSETCTYTLNLSEVGTYSLKVKAVGDGVNYSDSAWSEAYAYEIAEPVPEKLTAPQNLAVTEGILSWTAVANASSYKVKIGDGAENSVDTTSYTLGLTEYATYSITVKAVGDGEDYTDSDWSVAYTYEILEPVPEKLTAPQNLAVTEGILSWTAVANASSYKVKIGDGAENSVDTTSYTLGLTEYATYSITVKAVGDGEDYTDSDWSAAYTYELKEICHCGEKETCDCDCNPEKDCDCDCDTCSGGSQLTFEYNEASINNTETEKYVTLSTEYELPRPYKNNATFLGWNTKSDGTGTKYALSGTSWSRKGKLTLYAIWLSGVEELKFDKNGALTFARATLTDDLVSTKYLGKLIIPEYVNDTIVTKFAAAKTISGAMTGLFEPFQNINEVVLPNTLTDLANRAFANCSNLTTISVATPDGIVKNSLPRNLTAMGNSSFFKCKSLTAIIIPGTLKSISGNAFEGCTSLSNLVLSEGVETINNGAFRGNESMGGNNVLKELILPTSIKTIMNNILCECSALERVVLMGTTIPTMTATSFAGMNETMVFYVPASLLSEYRLAIATATGWTAEIAETRVLAIVEE